jgi:opacity protein-like surface antigen
MRTARMLVGVEGDIGWSNIENKIDIADSDTLTIKLARKLFYSARAMLGFLATPETLLYGTAGWASSQFEYSVSAPVIPLSESETHWIDGLQAGAGIETKLGGDRDARLE